MKKQLLFILLIVCFWGQNYVFGSNVPNIQKNEASPEFKTTLPLIVPASITSSVQSQPIDFGLCNKFFKLDGQKLFYLTLAGINANRFEINEIQSKSGYVLFSVAQRQFLASVIIIDSKNSMLKITPCNNIYYFPIGIVQNIFKYIELNQFAVKQVAYKL